MLLSHAMLLVGVLWVLPMLALALLFSEGEGLVETGCRFALEQGHPDGKEDTSQSEPGDKKRSRRKKKKS